MKFSIKDFFSKCDQIRWRLRIWSHLLKKSLMENFTFYAVLFIEIKKGKSFQKIVDTKHAFLYGDPWSHSISYCFFPYLNSDYYLHYYYPDKN